MKRIQFLIDQGEGDMLDFKKEISSVHRIAKTIVSFANHHGGTLLVGVNDDGSIAGIKADEENYMLEKASEFYCDPPINLTIREWVMKGKMILEVIVPEGFEKPYYAVDEEGKKWVYVRQKDQSLLASKVMVEVLKHKHSSRPVVVQYTSKEKALLEFLKQHPRITMKEYCKLVNISRWRAQKILINLTAVGVVRLHDIEKPEFYTLG
ncbi:MAG: ATP-binding protein [Bacteroidia bacterium]|jgi:predicted HTH transcriptional regulator|nr:ATP-binding protein [Bacteroidia bacterium]